MDLRWEKNGVYLSGATVRQGLLCSVDSEAIWKGNQITAPQLIYPQAEWATRERYLSLLRIMERIPFRRRITIITSKTYLEISSSITSLERHGNRRPQMGWHKLCVALIKRWLGLGQSPESYVRGTDRIETWKLLEKISSQDEWRLISWESWGIWK
jgi:hypothetical protein